MLQGKHITFSYSDSAKGKIDVLKDVSFEIREHDFIGLIGTSGSGKTTLIKHLNGLLKAESGEIFFNGENIYSKKYPISKLRKEVGLVFQYPEQQLFGRTILKDVMYGPLNLGMSEEEAEKSAVESLVKNAPDIEKLKQTSKELANQNHTDEGIAEIQPEQSDSKAEESTDKKQSTGGFTLKDRNFYQLCFASMERAIFYAKGVRLELPMKSSLYYLTREDAYYLLLEKGELSDKQLCRLLSASLEFADDIYAHGPTQAYIMEHGKCILPEQALEHLQEI